MSRKYFDAGWNAAESHDKYARKRDNLSDATITINGQPLSEFLEAEAGMEIVAVRIEVVTKLAKAVSKVNAPKSKRRGTGSGRGAGNPGVRKAKQFSQEEIAAENDRRGFKIVK